MKKIKIKKKYRNFWWFTLVPFLIPFINEIENRWISQKAKWIMIVILILVDCFFSFRELKTEEDIKEWLSINLEMYLEDGNLNAFVRSLEYVVRAKDNISNLSKKTGISRSNLYAIFKGEVTPQFNTVLKVLKELGYTLKVA